MKVPNLPHLPNLACGLPFMLTYAIHQHRRDHQGQMPRCFELHPALLPQLMIESGPDLYRDRARNGLLTDLLLYRGVEVAITVTAREPRLVTCRNEIEYL